MATTSTSTSTTKSPDEEKYYKALEKASKNISPKQLMRLQWTKMIIQRILTARELMFKEGAEKLPAAVKETLSNYDVVDRDGTNVLILKATELQSHKVIIALESSYEVVSQAHELTNHGGVFQMNNCLTQSDYVISEICLSTMAEVCSTCKKTDKNIEEAKNTLSERLAFIDIMDMLLQKNGEFTYLLIYQDYNTKFVQLRPLTGITNINQEVCIELIRLFADMGAPDCIKVLKPLELMFTAIIDKVNIFANLTVTFSKLAVWDGYVNKMAENVQTALKYWMLKNNSCWSIGCYFVQWEMNNAEDKLFGITPFMKMYGRKPNKSYTPVSSKIAENMGIPDEPAKQIDEPLQIPSKDSTYEETEVPEEIEESEMKLQDLILHEEADLGILTESDVKEEVLEKLEDQVETENQSEEEKEDQIIFYTSSANEEDQFILPNLITIDDDVNPLIETEDRILAPTSNLESSELIVPDVSEEITSDFKCCECKTIIRSNVYTCSKCNRCMHLYCGKKVPGDNCLQNICFACAAL